MFTQISYPLGNILHAYVDFSDTFNCFLYRGAALLGNLRRLCGAIGSLLGAGGSMAGSTGYLLDYTRRLLYYFRLFHTAIIDQFYCFG